MFKKKTKVQALDPETKIWTLATVLEATPEKYKLTWPGFSKEYNCWVEHHDVRFPLDKRPLLSRNAISKNNFPTREDPKRLEIDDEIIDTRNNRKLVIATNDPFDYKVIFIECVHYQYNFLLCY